MKDQPQTLSGRSYAVIVAGFFTVSVGYAVRYAFGMLLPEMINDLAISKTQAGTIFSTYFFLYSICAPLLGAWSDRCNYRIFLTVFAFIGAIGTLLMAMIDSFLGACLAFGVVALGHTACWAPVVALIPKWVPDHRKGMALSYVATGVGVGILIWGVLLPLIVAQKGWRGGWAAMGFFALFVTVLTWLLVRTPIVVEPSGTQLGARPKKQTFWSSYRPLMSDRAFWIIGISYLLAGFNVLVPFTFLPVYAREQLQLPYATATRFIVIIATAGIVGQLILGAISGRFSRVKLMMACGWIMGMGCLAMIFAVNEWHLYLVTAVYGIGYGAVWPIYAAIASDYFSKEQTGRVVGLWTALLGLGSIVSPVICGWTIDLSGSYIWTFLMGLISGTLSAVIPVRLPAEKTSP